MDYLFEQIYSTYKDQIYFFVKKYIQNKDDIEDVVQDIFVHLWKYKNNLDKNTEAIVFKTARQEVSNFYRKNKLQFSEGVNLEMITSSEHEKVDNDEYIKKLHLLLDDLPSKSKNFFLENKLNGLSYSEIAKENNISKNAVAKHVNKVLLYIKSRLSIFF